MNGLDPCRCIGSYGGRAWEALALSGRTLPMCCPSRGKACVTERYGAGMRAALRRDTGSAPAVDFVLAELDRVDVLELRQLLVLHLPHAVRGLCACVRACVRERMCACVCVHMRASVRMRHRLVCLQGHGLSGAPTSAEWSIVSCDSSSICAIFCAFASMSAVIIPASPCTPCRPVLAHRPPSRLAHRQWRLVPTDRVP
jgi:hypothetical protein